MSVTCPMCGADTPGGYGEVLTCAACRSEFGPLAARGGEANAALGAETSVASAAEELRPRPAGLYVLASLGAPFVAFGALTGCGAVLPSSAALVTGGVLAVGVLVGGVFFGATTFLNGRRWKAGEGIRLLGLLGAIFSVVSLLPLLLLVLLASGGKC